MSSKLKNPNILTYVTNMLYFQIPNLRNLVYIEVDFIRYLNYSIDNMFHSVIKCICKVLASPWDEMMLLT